MLKCCGYIFTLVSATLAQVQTIFSAHATRHRKNSLLIINMHYYMAQATSGEIARPHWLRRVTCLFVKFPYWSGLRVSSAILFAKFQEILCNNPEDIHDFPITYDDLFTS